MTDVGPEAESFVRRTKRMRCAILATALGLVACNGASLVVAEPLDAAAPAEEAGGVNPPGEDAGSSGEAAWDAAAYPFDASADFVTGVESTARIEDLDDAGASALCAWIVQEQAANFQGPCNDSMEGGVGYITGASAGIGGDPAAGPGPARGMTRVCLDSQYCIPNLRQAPCSATVAELVECVNTFVAVWTSSGQTGTSNWSELMAGCGAYEADPACRQTIFGFEQATCQMLLPIEPNATCN
jgi:hypothetical protein